MKQRRPIRPTHRKTDAEADYDVLRDLLKKEREACELQQQQIAERIGGEQFLLSKVEGGVRRIDPVELLAILDAMDVDPVRFVRLLKQRLAVRGFFRRRSAAAKRKK